MGVVFHATQESLNRPVAVKILNQRLSQNKDMVDRFVREAGAVAQLHHANVVGVIERGESQGFYYYVMQFVDGPSLNQLLRRSTPMTRDEFVTMTRHVMDALGYIHARHIVHRDIKPANILRDADGVYRLTDFGLIHVFYDQSISSISNAPSQNSGVVGTPIYMAPEQMTAGERITPATDIYSLCVVLYEMLTGNLPLGRFKMPSEVNPTVPQHLDEPLRRGLAREASERFQSIQEFARAFFSAIDHAPNLRLMPVKRLVDSAGSDPSIPTGATPTIDIPVQSDATGKLLLFGGVLLLFVAIAAVFALSMSPEKTKPTDRGNAMAAVAKPTPASTPADASAPVVPSLPWMDDLGRAAAEAAATDRALLLVIKKDGATDLSVAEADRGPLLGQVVPVALSIGEATEAVGVPTPPSLPYVYVMERTGRQALRESEWPVTMMPLQDFVARGAAAARNYARWNTSMDRAFDEAARLNRPIFLVATVGSSPGALATFKTDMASDPNLAKLAERTVLLSMELPEDQQVLMDEFGLLKFPLMALIDPQTGETIGEQFTFPPRSIRDVAQMFEALDK